MASWTRESGTSECMETIKEEKGRFDEWKLSARVFFANRTAVPVCVIFLLFVRYAIIVEVAPGLVGVQYPDSVVPPLFSITHPECVNQAPEPPSFAHPFGTTEYGVPGEGCLDVLQLVMKAIRIDLAISLFVASVAAAVGTVIGLVSADIDRLLYTSVMR